MNDPSITEYATQLGITPEALRKRLRKAGIKGYQNPKNKRQFLLSPSDRAILNTQSPNRETPTPQQDTQTHPIEVEVIEVIEVTPYNAPVFHVADRGGAIAALGSEVAQLNTIGADFLHAYRNQGIEEFAALGGQIGLEKARAFRLAEQAGLAQGLQGNVTPITPVTVGKSAGGAA